MLRFPHLPAVVLIGMSVAGTALSSFGDDDVPDAESTVETATSPPVTTTPGVQFEADFSTASGASLTTTNGANPQREGDLDGMYGAYGIMEGQSGTLTMRVTEDDTVNGPDDRPGVLRLQYVNVSPDTKYSGFLITGNQEYGKLQMPGWTLGEVTMADLRRTFIEFRFRADNPNNPVYFGGMYVFRLEPIIADPSAHRADFGALIATQRWRTFRRPISSATNLETFLKTINEENPPSFKLVWSQHQSIQGYSAGDSLLIDDLKIVIE